MLAGEACSANTVSVTQTCAVQENNAQGSFLSIQEESILSQRAKPFMQGLSFLLR